MANASGCQPERKGGTARWKAGGFIVLSVLLSCSPAKKPETASPGPWNLEGPPPYFVAHYMPWFEVQKSAADPAVSWTHWKWEDAHVKHDPEKRLPDGRRDIAAVDYPLIGVYNSWDRAVMAYHLKTAKAAGIAALLVIWYGPGSPEDSRISDLLDEAEKAGMRVALCYEEKINFPPYRYPQQREEVLENAWADLQYVVDRYGSHPAYLKRKGAPFIAQFNGWGTGRQGPNYLTSSEWRQILPSLHPRPVYCRQNLQDEYHPPIDAAYLWWAPEEDQKAFIARAQDLVGKGKLEFYMTMACPGFDDSGVYGWGKGIRKTPRENLKVFEKTFKDGLNGSPELVQLVTWNDFNEGSNLEPTMQDGFRYLEALATWIETHLQRPADLEGIRAPFYEYLRHASPAAKSEVPDLSAMPPQKISSGSLPPQ